MHLYRNKISLLISLCVSLCLSGCAMVHHYGTYEGKVVDTATGEPIVGAAVLAVYYTQSYSLAGSRLHYLDTQETVTDAQGEFKVPPLNTVTLRPLQSFEPWAWITIFKPGYAGYGCIPSHKLVEPKSWPFPPHKYVNIRLPKLTTYAERLEYYSCYPSPSVPSRSYSKLLYLINEEAVYLGLQPDVEPK